MDQEFMKKRKILPLVLSMALPMVISMAVNSLYNIVDSYFIAKMSEDALTALALVYPVQNLITGCSRIWSRNQCDGRFFSWGKGAEACGCGSDAGDGIQPAAWNHSDSCVHRWHAGLPSDVFLG